MSLTYPHEELAVFRPSTCFVHGIHQEFHFEPTVVRRAK